MRCRYQLWGGRMSNVANNQYVHLQRGGILLTTSSGNIQFGIPPETIKDTMQIEGGVPGTYVVPHHMFDITQGFALADIEFPNYYNFFIKKNKTRIVCTENQHKRLKIALSEALFGPKEIDLKDEFPDGESTPGFPDLRKEFDHFRKLAIGSGRRLELDDLLEFVIFDENGKASFENIEIYYDSLYNFHFFDLGQKIASVNRNIPLCGDSAEVQEKNLAFRPPLFGITMLGAGHGFDPNADTSGMIVWTNRRGVMVDPPVNSTFNLLRLGVNPKLIDNVILTHCHADHDAGTLQKILQEGKLNLYTTATIFNGFMRKSSALSGIEEKHIRKLIKFFPVTIGKSMKISGGEFQFNYTLHSIPTISIQVSLLGKSMIYSSDTINDPQYIDKIYQEGVISKNRRDFLIDFPWEKDVIMHEAGIPPLHTPLDYLCTLPPETRKRTFLVHVSADTIPKDSGLHIAPTGLANTLELDVNPLPFDDAIEVLDVISHIDIFSQLTINKARELLIIAKEERCRPGDVIFKKGDQGHKMYFIIDGRVDIVLDANVLTTYSTSDYFGEKSILLGEKRTATAIAQSDVRMFSIQKEDFLSFIRGTEIEPVLTNLARIQDTYLRDVLHANPCFRNLTPTQETQLHTRMQPVPQLFQPGTTILHENRPVDDCYVICQGRINVYKANKLIAVLKKGDLLDVTSIFNENSIAGFTFITEQQAKLYRIGRNALKQYLEKNPGFYIRMYYYHYYSKAGD